MLKSFFKRVATIQYFLIAMVVSLVTLLFFSGFVTNKVVSVSPKSMTRLCPDHIGGDREFNGHGPNVNCWAKLEIRNQRQVWVKVYLHAKETKSDWSECEGSWEKLLYECEPDWTIRRILTDMTSEASYTDTDHSLDAPSVDGGYLVRRFEVMGDTDDKDIGNCTDDDVYMNVYFNEVRIEIQ
jgi:hypothetical protein